MKTPDEMDSYVYEAQIKKYIDPDIFELVVDLGYGNWTTKVVKVRGYDAPRLNSNSLEESEHNITAGAKAWELLADKSLVIKSYLLGTRDPEFETFVNEYEVDIWVNDPEGESPWIDFASTMNDLGLGRKEEYEQNPDEDRELKPRPNTESEPHHNKD